jgi:hypothetical protein
MQQAGERYVKKGPDEAKSVYERRISEAVLLNVYKRTIGTLVGQVFSRDASLSAGEGKQLSEPFSSMAEDVDLQGNSLSVWSAGFFESAINAGAAVLFVDFPYVETRAVAGGGLEYLGTDGVWRKKTAEADAANGWRPYFVLIPQTHLLGWRFATVNGKRVLTQLRFMELVTEASGEWDVEDAVIDQVRVCTPGKWQVWRKVKSATNHEEWALHQEGVTSLSVVPAVPLILGETCGEMCAYPALEDLAHLNRRHWQSTVDQCDLISWMRRPVWVGSALINSPGDSMPFGPGTLINSTSTDAKLESVSVAPESVTKGQDELDKLEQQMSMYGMRLLLPRDGVQTTATQNNLESSETDSALKRWAVALKDCLEQALVFAGMWVNMDAAQVPSVSVNTEFHILDGMTVQEIATAIDKGIVSKRLAFDELKRRGQVPDDQDWMEVLAEIENDLRQSQGQGTSLGAGLAANLLGQSGTGLGV